MWSTLKTTAQIALRTTLVTLVLTGLCYPLALTGLCQLLFPAQAAGSLARDAKGRVVGSSLIAQRFTKPGYFQPRPSAAGEQGYDAASSGGSNLGVTSARLRERAQKDALRLQAQNPEAPGAIPAELVTASGSGLDPHLSPQAVLWQAPRVARARGVAVERVRALIMEKVEGRQLGVLGEPRVNVLQLNLALDRWFGRPAQAPR